MIDLLLKVPRVFPFSLAATDSHSFTAMSDATFLAVNDSNSHQKQFTLSFIDTHFDASIRNLIDMYFVTSIHYLI